MQSGGLMEAKAMNLLFMRNSLSLKEVISWARWHVSDHTSVAKSAKLADILLRNKVTAFHVFARTNQTDVQHGLRACRVNKQLDSRVLYLVQQSLLMWR